MTSFSVPTTSPLARLIRPRRRAVGRFARATVGVIVLAVAACAPGFEAAKFSNPVDLYRAAGQRMQRHKWEDALAGYDRLASQLPARDTLLPRVYFSQGTAHAHQGEHLLAAQAYARIQDAFPDDSLAPEALFQEGREYQKLWDKPALDAQYGQTALATFRQLLQLYPDSPRVPDATHAVADVNQMFAAKDLETGMHYLRRKAYDPALIYFKDVVRLYPGTPAARAAYLRMVQSYRAINYKEEIAEACTDMRRTYPADPEIRQSCATAPALPATATTAGTPGSGAAASAVTPVNAPGTAAPSTTTPSTTTPGSTSSTPVRPAPVPQAAESSAGAGGGRP